MSTSPFRNIAIIGAGKPGGGSTTRTRPALGSYILEKLVENPSFNVTVVSRESSSSVFEPSQKVIKVPDSYPEDAMVAALKGQDAMVLTLSPMAGDVAIPLIDAAIKAGVKRIFPSEFGSCVPSDKVAQTFPFATKNAKVVAYLKSKESMGITWTAVMNGLLLDFIFGSGFLFGDLSGEKAAIWDGGTCRFSSTTRSDVGIGVAKALSNPEKTANRYVYILSVNATMNELLEATEKATGGQKWEVERVNGKDEMESGKEMLAAGNFMQGAGKLARGISFTPGFGADYEAEGVLDNEMLGMPKRDVDEVVEEIMKELK